MGVVVEYPITVHVDNVGAILPSENISISKRMKHIDLRHHFIHDYVEEGTVKNKFVRSEESMVDPFTNNLIMDRFNHLHQGAYTVSKI